MTAQAPSLKESYAYCVRLTKQRARNFYYAFVTLPRSAREGICAVYAYCRMLDDIADGAGSPNQKAREIDRAESEMLKSLRTRPRSLLYAALADTVRRYGIPAERLLEVGAGVRQDLRVTRYATFDELKSYCYLVASSVGLACLEVFGYDDPEAAREAAVDMGIAMQLTNVLRDIAEDAARDRIYLPREDLERFGVSEKELADAVYSPRVEALILYQIERAERYYRSAERLFRHVPRRSRPCPMVLLGVYKSLLEAIKSSPSEVFARRVSISSRRKMGLALSLWVRGVLWKPPA